MNIEAPIFSSQSTTWTFLGSGFKPVLGGLEKAVKPLKVKPKPVQLPTAFDQHPETAMEELPKVNPRPKSL